MNSSSSFQLLNYYPYGMQMPGRHGTDGDGYRYGFQGQEKDDEVKGEGNSVNYKYRMHDPRIGRFFAVDPLASKYPYYSQYAFSGNRVVDAVELEGLEPAEAGKIGGPVVLAPMGGNKNNIWAWEWQKKTSTGEGWIPIETKEDYAMQQEVKSNEIVKKAFKQQAETMNNPDLSGTLCIDECHKTINTKVDPPQTRGGFMITSSDGENWSIVTDKDIATFDYDKMAALFGINTGKAGGGTASEGASAVISAYDKVRQMVEKINQTNNEDDVSNNDVAAGNKGGSIYKRVFNIDNTVTTWKLNEGIPKTAYPDSTNATVENVQTIEENANVETRYTPNKK